MSLLASLGLAAVPSSVQRQRPVPANTPSPSPSPPAKAQRKGKGKGGANVTTIDFEEGETVVAGEPTVRKLPIGQIVWANGQGKRQIWGLINTAGDLAQGGGSWHEKALGEMNTVAARGVQLVVGLQEREEKFRLDLAQVKSAVKEGARGLAEVRKLGPAIAKRMKDDPDFYQDVKGFTSGLAEARKTAKGVAKAAKDFQAATNALHAAVLDEKTYRAEKDVADAEAAVQAKQKQIDETKAVFMIVVDIATKVAKQEWGAIASKALEYAQDKALDAAADALVAGRLIEQLDRLKANLDKARAKVDEFKEGALDARLQERQSALEAAATALEMAHDALKDAVADLPGAQQNAINELNESSSTAAAGKMIAARATQIASVEVARASCGAYVQVADKAQARMQQFVELFRQISTFLPKAAKDKPYYAEDRPYGGELYRASLANSIAFGDWATSIPGVKREAEEALKWLARTDAEAPLGPFDQAIESTRKDLGRGA